MRGALVGANLAGVDLDETNFNGADLTNANLSGTSLQETNFKNATLTGVNVTGATWHNTTCPDGSKHNTTSCV